MSDLIWLSGVQKLRIERHYPFSHGVAILPIRDGQRWRAAVAQYGSVKTIYVCLSRRRGTGLARTQSYSPCSSSLPLSTYSGAVPECFRRGG